MKKNKELYLIFFWAALIIIVIIIFIIPNVIMISDSAKNIKETLAKLENLEKTSQNKEEVQKNYQIIKDNYAVLDQLIPKKGEELNFITTLEEIANDNNVQQKMNLLLAEAGQNKNTPANILPFQLTLDGNLYNILNYLNDLESNEFYLNINKIEINQNASPSQIDQEQPLILTNNIHLVLTGNSNWQ